MIKTSTEQSAVIYNSFFEELRIWRDDTFLTKRLAIDVDDEIMRDGTVTFNTIEIRELITELLRLVDIMEKEPKDE